MEKCVADFVKKYGTACGGNWSAMLMSAIRNGLPYEYKKLNDDKAYEFGELFDIIAKHTEYGN